MNHVTFDIIYIDDKVPVFRASYTWPNTATVQATSLEGWTEALRILDRQVKLLDCGVWPSGHKVWRIIVPEGQMPTINIETTEYGPMCIEPTDSYSLEANLTEWVGVDL